MATRSLCWAVKGSEDKKADVLRERPSPSSGKCGRALWIVVHRSRSVQGQPSSGDSTCPVVLNRRSYQLPEPRLGSELRPFLRLSQPSGVVRLSGCDGFAEATLPLELSSTVCNRPSCDRGARGFEVSTGRATIHRPAQAAQPSTSACGYRPQRGCLRRPVENIADHSTLAPTSERR